jgi:formimidoylglutamate deiminase
LTNALAQTWLADLVYHDGQFLADTAVVCDEQGKIVRLAPAAELPDAVTLKNRALLPGLVDAHSHAFQRVIRGRTEYRNQDKESFWTWRDQMYRAANQLDPDEIYTASKMAFLEMALSGITAVGEFHYIHNGPTGVAYEDPNLLEKQVVRAAHDVGIRIALLRVAYARAGFQVEANPLQRRFIEETPDVYLERLAELGRHLNTDMAWIGIAPHSVRAVPLGLLKEIVSYANSQVLPVHMHVAEQPAEVSACIEEYGRSPVALLDTEGLLSERFTAVHAIHVTPKAIQAMAKSKANVCACPTTERNLGDGIVPVEGYFRSGVSVSLGTDSQTQIDLMEDARELEYHLRLQKMERNVLASDSERASLARKLFDCATVNGASSIGFAGGKLARGAPADFFTVDLNDPSIASASHDELLSNIIFSMSRSAVRDVIVAGRRIVEDGRHSQQDQTVEAFRDLQRKLWG